MHFYSTESHNHKIQTAHARTHTHTHTHTHTYTCFLNALLGVRIKGLNDEIKDKRQKYHSTKWFFFFQDENWGKKVTVPGWEELSPVACKIQNLAPCLLKVFESITPVLTVCLCVCVCARVFVCEPDVWCPPLWVTLVCRVCLPSPLWLAAVLPQE